MTAHQLTRLRTLTGCDEPCAVLNALTDLGLISDLCVTADDVAHVDAEMAISRLSSGLGQPSLNEKPHYETEELL